MNSVNDAKMSEFLQSTLEECLDLVSAAQFTLLQGCYLQGSRTAVSVLVNPHPVEAGSHCIQILCHAGGHLKLDWDGVPVILVDRLSRDERLGFLDSRGNCEFMVDFSEESAYRLEVPPTNVSVAVEATALAAAAADSLLSPMHFHAVSADQLLEATADLKPGPELHVVIRARQSEGGYYPLRNGKAHLLMRSRSSKAVLLQASIDLDLEDGLAGAWRTREKLQDLTEDAELLIFAARSEEVH